MDKLSVPPIPELSKRRSFFVNPLLRRHRNHQNGDAQCRQEIRIAGPSIIVAEEDRPGLVALRYHSGDMGPTPRLGHFVH